MSRRSRALAACVAVLAIAAAAHAVASQPPSDFESRGDDRAAIEALLHTYTTAVSSKDEGLYETLLLNREIPFSSAAEAIAARGRPHGADNYEAFRRGVFHGPPFTQRFSQVRVDQDGPLAQVSLVFTNTSASGVDWGFKTLQLLKVDGRWKIVSEFFTNHG